MTTSLTPVEPTDTATVTRARAALLPNPASPTLRQRLIARRQAAEFRRAGYQFDGARERGAVTAEYAIVIMAAVAFAGLLVVIMRSEQVRATLTGLIEKALNSGG